jgi:hypothetical protein
MSREVHVRFCESIGVKFPGATQPHICGTTRKGYFTVRRQTSGKRMRAKLQQIKQQLRSRMHHPVAQTGDGLKSVVQGYFNYHAVPGKIDRLGVFRERVTRLWRGTLIRRSQNPRFRWTRMHTLAARWIPHPRVLHPYPEVRFAARCLRCPGKHKWHGHD